MPRIRNPFKSIGTRAQGWFLTGILTLIPIWITWVIFTFMLGQLSALGRPAARKVTEYLGPLAGWFAGDAMQTALALILTASSATHATPPNHGATQTPAPRASPSSTPPA